MGNGEAEDILLVYLTCEPSGKRLIPCVQFLLTLPIIYLKELIFQTPSIMPENKKNCVKNK
jgi:hypothetical protein